MDTGDTGWRAEYRPKLATLVERHGGRFLVRGRATKELLEGKEKLPDTIVVMEFPTNWDTMFWNSGAAELTARIEAAWRVHAPHPNLPAEIRPMLNEADFRLIRQAPVTIINNAYHEDTFSYWLARLIVAFVTNTDGIDEDDGARWLSKLERAQTEWTFFFSSTPVVSLAPRLHWRRYQPTTWVFPNRAKDGPLSRTTVQHIYTATRRRAGIAKGKGIHTLRVCFATHLLQAGTDLRTIQLLMGHTSILSTQRYLRLNHQNLGATQSPLDLLDL